MLFTKPTAAETRAPAVQIPDYPLFDWLRFALASAVALGHAKVITWGYSGNLAVQVFFALSGWLIGGILLRSSSSDLPRFFFNRATRIWVPYLAAIVALYLVSAARDPVSWRWFEFLFYDATFTHNWFSLKPDPASAIVAMPLQGTGNHFWSISVEEQFYLVAPLLIVSLRYGRSPLFWIATIPVLWLINFDFSSIGLGVLGATLHARYGAWHLNAASISALAVAFALSAFAMAAGWSYQLAAPVFGIATVLLCARPGHRSSLSQFFGGISYPMYLNHWIGAFIVHGLAKRSEWVTETGLASYLLGVTAGAIAYLLIDRTILKYRDLWFTHSRGKLLGGAAYAAVITGIAFGIWRWYA